MSRRRRYRQPYRRDSGNVSTLSREELEVALRAAEDLIATGGRGLLVKVLRGSQAQDVRPELARNPAYGAWKHLSQEEVAHRVDWCIQEGYLGIQYDGKLPLLIYGPPGLAIECRTIAGEWFQRAIREGFDAIRDKVAATPLRTQLALLDRIAESGRENGEPILKAWSKETTKRLRGRIRAVQAEWAGTGPRQRYVFETCWIDGSIPFGVAGKFEQYARNQKIFYGKLEYVAREHAGMMDDAIYRSLLQGKSACLVTNDCAFHNALCETGVSSFYYDAERSAFTVAPIPGVQPRGILARLSSAPAPKDPVPSSRTRANPELTRFLTPKGVSAQKKLRAKRRRIHNYFGEIGRILQCNLAVAQVMHRGLPLVGVRLRVLSNGGVKALDASELYFQEESGDFLGAYIQAGALMLQFQLESVPTELYYDSHSLPGPESLKESPAFAFWQEIAAAFTELHFRAIGERPRSPRMDVLRRKLSDLAARPSNEIKRHNSVELARQWDREQSGSTG